MNVQNAIKELQDNLLVMADLERRQSKLLLEHSELLTGHRELIAEGDVFRRRTEQNLAEITDKLSGLIGYIDGMNPPDKN